MWQGHLLLSPGWITPRLPTSSIKAGKHAERWRDEAHVNLHLVSSGPFRVFGACEKETGILLHCRAFLSLLAVARKLTLASSSILIVSLPEERDHNAPRCNC